MNDPSSVNPYESPEPGFGPYEEPGGRVPKRGSGMAVASLVLGIVGLLAWCCPLVGLAVTITGLVLGILGLQSESRGMAMAGTVLCGLGLVLSLGNAIWGAYLVASGQHPLFQ